MQDVAGRPVVARSGAQGQRPPDAEWRGKPLPQLQLPATHRDLQIVLQDDDARVPLVGVAKHAAQRRPEVLRQRVVAAPLPRGVRGVLDVPQVHERDVGGAADPTVARGQGWQEGRRGSGAGCGWRGM